MCMSWDEIEPLWTEYADEEAYFDHSMTASGIEPQYWRAFIGTELQ